LVEFGEERGLDDPFIPDLGRSLVDVHPPLRFSPSSAGGFLPVKSAA
jgi:hypothetical protein